MAANGRRTGLLLTTLALASLVGLLACEKEKNEDYEASEQTTPSCQILWSAHGANVGRFDLYVVAMFDHDWTSGTKALDRTQGRFALFYDEYEPDSGEYVARAMATNGTLTVTVSSGSLAVGSAVSLLDTGGKVYFDVNSLDQVNGPVIGSGGEADFDGVWSANNADIPTPGSGLVEFVYHGSSLTIGTYTRYAQCQPVAETGDEIHSGVRIRLPRTRK